MLYVVVVAFASLSGFYFSRWTGCLLNLTIANCTGKNKPLNRPWQSSCVSHLLQRSACKLVCLYTHSRRILELFEAKILPYVGSCMLQHFIGLRAVVTLYLLAPSRFKSWSKFTEEWTETIYSLRLMDRRTDKSMIFPHG